MKRKEKSKALIEIVRSNQFSSLVWWVNTKKVHPNNRLAFSATRVNTTPNTAAVLKASMEQRWETLVVQIWDHLRHDITSSHLESSHHHIGRSYVNLWSQKQKKTWRVVTQFCLHRAYTRGFEPLQSPKTPYNY